MGKRRAVGEVGTKEMRLRRVQSSDFEAEDWEHNEMGQLTIELKLCSVSCIKESGVVGIGNSQVRERSGVGCEVKIVVVIVIVVRGVEPGVGFLLDEMFRLI